MDVDLGICFNTRSYFTDDDQASLEWSWLLATDTWIIGRK
jgi:hypothetical protein